jgi:hypothetical protein
MSDDYDYAAYRAKHGDPEPGKHLPDEFKKPNHITFSDESIYHSEETPGGKWSRVGNVWHFAPSDYNLQQYPPDVLREYFKTVEPNAVLDLPGVSKFQQYQESLQKGPGE